MLLTSIRDTINNGYNSVFIFLLSLVCISFGISIIITKNPVVSVLFLIGLFVSVAIYLMMLGLYFIGLSYLLVYVGAVSILFLFILMLINIRTSELTTEGKNSLPLAIIAVVSFNLTVNGILPYCVYIFDVFSSYNGYIYKLTYQKSFLTVTTGVNRMVSEYTTSFKEAIVTSKSWEGYLIENSHISAIGNILYSNLSILLIIVSLILLLAMVGTIIITMKRISNLKQSLLVDNAERA